jgi:Skp family chaperone for outer membrane proteins
MKNLLVRFVTGLWLVSLTISATADDHIATVDIRKVFENYWKRKEGDVAIKEKAATMEKDHKSMLDDYKKMKDDYQGILTGANDQAVSSEEREKRKKNAEDKLRQLKSSEESIVQYEKTARDTIEQQVRRMRDNIIAEIKTVVTAKAQAGGYAIVMDSAAETVNNTPVLIYCENKKNDLTEPVLSQLNATAPSNSSSTEEKKADSKK